MRATIRTTIRRLPECTDWTGRHYPARWGVTIIDTLGYRWDGGEFATRDLAEQRIRQLGGK
jgi:hypothetical protein